MNILTVVGARPQFIKASAVSRAMRAVDGMREVLVHTGQHVDPAMSEVFFNELSLQPPDYHLEVSGGGHGRMTGRMLERLEPIVEKERPDAVLVYGDTNSTVAGALVAAKLRVPVVHVEAGLRAYREGMPEEINRRVTDHVSTLLCCPTRTAVDNLRREGFVHVLNGGAPVSGEQALDGPGPWVANCGDVMVDVLFHYRAIAARTSTILDRLQLVPGHYGVLTIHRAENTETSAALCRLLDAVAALAADLRIVFAVHPRTERLLQDSAEPGHGRWGDLIRVPPLPYLDFIQLQANARVIMTDSGGVQKEAYCLGVPCLTLRDETEWPETSAGGWNRIVGSVPEPLDRELIPPSGQPDPTVFGGGDAALRIVRLMRTAFGSPSR